MQELDDLGPKVGQIVVPKLNFAKINKQKYTAEMAAKKNAHVIDLQKLLYSVYLPKCSG